MLGAIFGVAGGLLNMFGKQNLANRQQGLANAIRPINTTYEENPYAKQMLGMAQQAYNSEAPGAGMLRNTVFANQGNAMANIERNATDASQSLALLGGVQGQTNDALGRLQQREQEYKAAQLGNLNNAYGAMINEGDKVYRDKVRRYETDLNAKAALQGAAIQNRASATNDIAQMLPFVGNAIDNSGGLKGLFGGKTGMTSGNMATLQTPQSVNVNNPLLGRTIPSLSRAATNQSVEPVWSDVLGTYVDPITGQPV